MPRKPRGVRCRPSNRRTRVGTGRPASMAKARGAHTRPVGSLPESSVRGVSATTRTATRPSVVPHRATDAEMADAFASLCARCDVEFHLPGDTLGPACRREIELAFAELPG
jgi:hypothetical protein